MLICLSGTIKINVKFKFHFYHHFCFGRKTLFFMTFFSAVNWFIDATEMSFSASAQIFCVSLSFRLLLIAVVFFVPDKTRTD